MSPTKYVYDFSEGNATMKSLLGGKGANLAEMTGLGIPVPPGFIVTTAACVHYSTVGSYPEGLEGEIEAHLRALEKLTGKTLGDPKNPLLLSIRSGAVFSMPGMMDTVLNLGLNDETVEGLAQGTDNPRFAYDSYRRFISMFGDVVMGVDPQLFEDALTAKKAEVGAALDTESVRRRSGGSHGPLQDHLGRARGRAVPRRPVASTAHEHRGRLQELGQPPGQGLPPHPGHPR